MKAADAHIERELAGETAHRRKTLTRALTPLVSGTLRGTKACGTFPARWGRFHCDAERHGCVTRARAFQSGEPNPADSHSVDHRYVGCQKRSVSRQIRTKHKIRATNRGLVARALRLFTTMQHFITFVPRSVPVSFAFLGIFLITALAGSVEAQSGGKADLPDAPFQDARPANVSSDRDDANQTAAEAANEHQPADHSIYGELSFGLRVSQPVLRGEDGYLVPRGELSFRVFGPLFVGAYLEAAYFGMDTGEPVGLQAGALVRASRSFRLDNYSRFLLLVDVYGGYSSVNLSGAQEDAPPSMNGGELGTWLGLGLEIGKGAGARGTLGIRAGYVRRFGMNEALVTPGSFQGLASLGWRF